MAEISGYQQDTKYCKNCIYFFIPDYLVYKCAAPENFLSPTPNISLVTGTPVPKFNSCEEARAAESGCGLRGFWYKELLGKQVGGAWVGSKYSAEIKPKLSTKVRLEDLM